ncbi:MAG: polyphosphate kinase 2 family protein [Candidatus Nanopelagicales bacterium]|jgi:PPK2 family polyphosphate:nucleotide phosphotransferase|nr:polyphosphate kinase 2 family protein [Candidatus Nanopelagicales bacterium]
MTDDQRARIQEFIAPLLVQPGSTVRLPDDFDPGYSHPGLSKADAPALLEAGIEHLAELQDRLYSQDTYGVLFVLQAMDAAGKDGMIKHVMSGINPQGVHVTSFKAPSAEDRDHTYLWRVQRAVPARGMIGIFNRSHYEDVLVVKVHPEYLRGAQLPPSALEGDIWARRYREINDFERHLVDNGIKVVKVFLNVSKEEQRARFLSRIEDPAKNWKFSSGDVDEREHWDAYQQAFAEALSATSTEHAPWYVVPADKKWFARLCGAAILAHTLLEIDPRYPTLAEDELAGLAASRERLLAEGPLPEED